MNSNRSNIAARGAFLSAAACVALALGACTTLGTGTGTASPGNQPVSFSWISKDGGVTGTMTASLAGGTYTGPYLEITSTARTEQLYPMWLGWRRGWNDWDWSLDGSITNYSGKVAANLQGPDSRRMRCRFNLNEPLSGMGGGGQGKCQVAGGSTIDAVFPKA
jgi:hypothetical protein